MVHPRQINFCLWYEVGVEVHFFFIYKYPILAPFVENPFFPHWIVLVHPLKSNCPSVGSISEFCSIPFILYIFISILHCLDFYSFMIILESDSVSTTFLFFLNILLAVLDPLHYHINVKNHLVHFYLKACWDYELQIILGEDWLLNNIEPMNMVYFPIN